MLDFLRKFLSNTAPKQEGLGAILNDKDSRDIQLDSFQPEVDLPEEYITDISMLPVSDQGILGTCVAQVLALIKQFNEYQDTKELIAFSKRFIYHFARKFSGLLDSQNEGLPPRMASKVLTDKGVCKSIFLPETKGSHHEYSNPSPTLLALSNALDFRVLGYAFGGEGEREIKRALINNKLLGISLPVDRNAWDRKTGKISKPNFSNLEGRHYVTLYGYSGDRFYIRNSWSKSWGNNGNGYFKFSDYAGLIKDVVAFTDIPQKLIEEAKNKPYIFSAVLRKGSRGEAVKQLQKKLTELGYFIGKVDGIFGPLTHLAVFSLQVNNDLNADGIVGKNTNDFLNGHASPPAKKMELVDALIQVESGGDDNAIGDKHLTDKAYGCLQIRKPCITDVNRANGTNYVPEQMLGNRQLSLWVFKKYMELYATEARLGRIVTDEDRARLWNGGIGGMTRNPHPNPKIEAMLSNYWSKVKKLLV